MNDNMTLIDSNLLVYAVDISEPGKQSVCKELLGDCWKLKRRYAVSIQNLSEFYVIATTKIENPIPQKEARRFISKIVEFRNWEVISPTANTIAAAINLSIDHNIHYWDAMIAATMRENQIFSIYTEDGHFSRIPWLTAINPMDSIEEVI